ncbi:MAG: protein kinase domain-containing protein [Anaerolineae bacterium]
MEDLSGVTLGSYRLVEKIGQGAVSVVYRAYQPSLERWVAVKVLDPAYVAQDQQFIARFRREAKAIAALRHPNILIVYDCGEQNGLEYIAMEYVAGGALTKRLTGEPFPWKRAVGLALGIGQALVFAHSRGIIHRDVKPGNVLLPTEDWPLLADFGLVKLKHAKQSWTDPGMPVGTPAYISPEQALGGEVDHRTDIYALGVMLFEMVTGQVPFQATKTFDMLLKHISEPPPSPRALVPEIPEALEHIILRALAKEPDERYQDMANMVADMETLGPFSTITRPPEAAAQRSKRFTAELRDLRPLLRGPHFIIVNTGVPVPIPLQDEVVIGRSDPVTNTMVDIDLTSLGGISGGVSRQHARLVFAQNAWTIEDLDSTNGTYLNGVPLRPFEPQPLHDGDQVQLGQMVLIFHLGEVPESA